MSDLVIIGAGGHGKVVFEIARAAGFRSVTMADSAGPARSSVFQLAPVLAMDDRVFDSRPHAFVIAVGDNETRARLFAATVGRGWTPATLMHPSAIVSPSARVERGSVVLPGAIINACARVGENCIINSGAIVEHDCRIDAHAHVSPGAALGGGVRVGCYSHIGLNAAVLPGVKIGRRTTVGAGAVVLSGLPDGVTAVGVPARSLNASAANGSGFLAF